MYIIILLLLKYTNRYHTINVRSIKFSLICGSKNKHVGKYQWINKIKYIIASTQCFSIGYFHLFEYKKTIHFPVLFWMSRRKFIKFYTRKFHDNDDITSKQINLWETSDLKLKYNNYCESVILHVKDWMCKSDLLWGLNHTEYKDFFYLFDVLKCLFYTFPERLKEKFKAQINFVPHAIGLDISHMPTLSLNYYYQRKYEQDTSSVHHNYKFYLIIPLSSF